MIRKRYFFMFLFAALYSVCFLCSVSLADEGDIAYIHWKLEDNVLTFSGEGIIAAEGPWQKNIKKIKQIEFGPEVTAFNGDVSEFKSLETVVFYEKIFGNYSDSTKLTAIRFTGKKPELKLSGFTHLKSIEFDDPDVNFIREGDFLFDREKKTLLYYFETKANKKVSVPEGVVKIGANAFEEKKKIQVIELPSTLVEIDDAAFGSCEGLTEVVLPESLVRIGRSAFSNCSKLKSVVFPASLKSIGGWAFMGCKKIKSFIFQGESILFENYQYIDVTGKTIDEENGGVFSICESLEKITLPACENVPERCFWFCKNLKEVNLNENTGHISSNAFLECKKLKTLYIPDNTTFEKEIIDNVPLGFVIQCHSRTKAEKQARMYELKHEIVE